MQDNFNIRDWQLKQALKEMDEATFTDKHDDNPKLKGGQKDLPDELQAKIVAKEGMGNEVGDKVYFRDDLGEKYPASQGYYGIIEDATPARNYNMNAIYTVIVYDKNDNEIRTIKTDWTNLTSKIVAKENSNSEDILEDMISDMLKYMSKEEVLQRLQQILANADSNNLNENEDHEVSMAQNSLKSIMSSASKLMAILGNEERDIPGWIQDHITNAENFIDQAAQGFHELEDKYEED